MICEGVQRYSVLIIFKSQHFIINLSISFMDKLQQLHFVLSTTQIYFQFTVLEEDRNQKISHIYQADITEWRLSIS